MDATGIISLLISCMASFWHVIKKFLILDIDTSSLLLFLNLYWPSKANIPIVKMVQRAVRRSNIIQRSSTAVWALKIPTSIHTRCSFWLLKWVKQLEKREAGVMFVSSDSFFASLSSLPICVCNWKWRIRTAMAIPWPPAKDSRSVTSGKQLHCLFHVPQATKNVKRRCQCSGLWNLWQDQDSSHRQSWPLEVFLGIKSPNPRYVELWRYTRPKGNIRMISRKASFSQITVLIRSPDVIPTTQWREMMNVTLDVVCLTSLAQSK